MAIVETELVQTRISHPSLFRGQRFHYQRCFGTPGVTPQFVSAKGVKMYLLLRLLNTRCLQGVRLSALLMLASVQVMTVSASTRVDIEYVYDDLNRLKEVGREDGPLTEYTYDEATNIVSRVTTNSPDTDGDLLGDFADEDDDNDAIPDDVEIANMLDPLDATDAAGDRDGDGISNVFEYQTGSDISHYHGDVNDDAAITLADVVLVKRILLELESATTEQELPGHGDANLNGKLDVGDLVIIQGVFWSQ